MEFLKNHYEKILLSLVLIGLAGAAVMLAIQALETRTQMSDLSVLKPNVKKAPDADNLGSYSNALRNAKAPQRVDFDGAHKIFNPEKVLRNQLTGVLIPNGEVGPKNLQIKQIRPLRLVVRAESKTIVGRKRLYLHYLAEFEQGSMGMRWNKRTISKVGSKIYMVGPLSKMKQMMFTVNDIGDQADEISVDLDLTIGGGLPVPIQLRGTNAWEREMEYSIDLHYPPESRDFLNVRANTALFPAFGGDTNFVIQITSNAVTLRSMSNQKRITLRWKDEEPLPPAPMNPVGTNTVSTNLMSTNLVSTNVISTNGFNATNLPPKSTDAGPPSPDGGPSSPSDSPPGPTGDKKPAPTP